MTPTDNLFFYPAMVRGPQPGWLAGLKNLWVSVGCADDSTVRFAIARPPERRGRTLRPWRSAKNIQIQKTFFNPMKIILDIFK
jgi:hypothetical protein